MDNPFILSLGKPVLPGSQTEYYFTNLACTGLRICGL
jgi:hypothetical protein